MEKSISFTLSFTSDISGVEFVSHWGEANTVENIIENGADYKDMKIIKSTANAVLLIIAKWQKKGYNYYSEGMKRGGDHEAYQKNWQNNRGGRFDCRFGCIGA